MLVDRAAGFAGADIVSHVVREGGELVEDDVARRSGEFSAFIVDFLDVAFDADGAHDVRRAAHPALEPFETLPAHPFGQNGHTVAAEDARDRDAAATIVPGRRPDRAIAGRIEAARDQPGDETGSTLCAPIIGNRDPIITTIGVSTPVSAFGRTIWSGIGTVSRRLGALRQWMRQRLSGWGASGSTPGRRAAMCCGMGTRQESCANIGSTIFCARARPIAERRVAASTTAGASASPLRTASVIRALAP